MGRSLSFSGASANSFAVKKCFFYFGNVLIEKKNDQENAEELIELLIGPVFDFYYGIFAADDIVLHFTTSAQIQCY